MLCYEAELINISFFSLFFFLSREQTSKFSKPYSSSMGVPKAVNPRKVLPDNKNPGPGKYSQAQNAFDKCSGMKGAPKSVKSFSFGTVKPGQNAHSIW